MLSKKNYFTIFFIFAVSKLFIFFYLEIKPIDTLFHHWQLLDKELLQYDLLQSIFYLHTQPFLWNLLIGFLTKAFNGNEKHIINFILVYHITLTWIVIILINKIINFYDLTKLKIFFINLFVIFNPGIVFFENEPIYAHTIFFLFSLSIYFIFNYFHKNQKKYLICFYLSLLILTFIWSAFHPILFVIVYIALELIGKNNKKINRYLFIFFFSISLIPTLKNFIIFNTSSSAFLGYTLAMHTQVPNCGMSPSPIREGDEEKYRNKLNSNIKNHPSFVGPLSKYNNIGMIYRSKHCKTMALNFIKKNPLAYIKIVAIEFMSFHGQWIIDFAIIEHPKNWEKIYKITKEIQNQNNLKRTRQIINIFFIFFIYLYFFKKVFFSNIKNNKKHSILMTFILYAYIVAVGTIISKYEGVRFMYAGYLIIVLFLVELFSSKKSRSF
ncbi:hypothetical protein N8444_03960 [Pelagibacteraceae bacterium]|nr:hypothetical protein [Pelagibacteraceae bacterium]